MCLPIPLWTERRYDSHFGTAVSEELACDSTPAPAPFGPGRNLTDVLAANRKVKKAKQDKNNSGRKNSFF